MLTSSGRRAALFAGMVASLLVVVVEFGFHVGVAYFSAKVLFRFDCVMGGYVRGCIWIVVSRVEAVELGFDSFVASKYPLHR